MDIMSLTTEEKSKKLDELLKKTEDMIYESDIVRVFCYFPIDLKEELRKAHYLTSCIRDNLETILMLNRELDNNEESNRDGENVLKNLDNVIPMFSFGLTNIN